MPVESDRAQSHRNLCLCFRHGRFAWLIWRDQNSNYAIAVSGRSLLSNKDVPMTLQEHASCAVGHRHDRPRAVRPGIFRGLRLQREGLGCLFPARFGPLGHRPMAFFLGCCCPRFISGGSARAGKSPRCTAQHGCSATSAALQAKTSPGHPVPCHASSRPDSPFATHGGGEVRYSGSFLTI